VIINEKNIKDFLTKEDSQIEWKDDGFYILTEPLTKGNYSVHFKSSLICLDVGCAEPNFAQDIKYNIIAE
jgi:hypothetical protein